MTIEHWAELQGNNKYIYMFPGIIYVINFDCYKYMEQIQKRIHSDLDNYVYIF